MNMNVNIQTSLNGVKKMSKQEFKKYYQKKEVTSTYIDQRMATQYRRDKRAKEFRIFLDLLNKKPGEKVLEIGASGGCLTKFLGKVIALNISKEMLRTIKEKNPEAKLVCSDMFKLPKPFKPASFDKIVSVRVMTHLKQDELLKVLKKINLTLKDNGRLVFDLEEYSIIRQIARLIYTHIFNIFRKNKILGYPVYQYKLFQAIEILHKAKFEVIGLEFLPHKVGRQIMFLARKTVKKPEKLPHAFKTDTEYNKFKWGGGLR